MPITCAYGGHYFSPTQAIWLDALVLAGIQSREFFDAAVPVEMIEAVLARNRP